MSKTQKSQESASQKQSFTAIKLSTARDLKISQIAEITGHTNKRVVASLKELPINSYRQHFDRSCRKINFNLSGAQAFLEKIEKIMTQAVLNIENKGNSQPSSHTGGRMKDFLATIPELPNRYPTRASESIPLKDY